MSDPPKAQGTLRMIIESFRFKYENEYEYKFTDVLTLRMCKPR